MRESFYALVLVLTTAVLIWSIFELIRQDHEDTEQDEALGKHLGWKEIKRGWQEFKAKKGIK